MLIHLITNPFVHPDPERNAEIRLCVRRNRILEMQGVIHQITEVWEDRKTFGELFSLCLPGMVNVVANADIFLDTTIQKTGYMKKHQAFALSRWDVSTWKQGQPVSTLFNRRDSQDTWIIVGEAHRILKEADYFMGIPGCDNRLAHDLLEAGYEVSNPSVTIRTHHLHLTNLRQYTAKTEPVPGPYHLIQPTSLR